MMPYHTGFHALCMRDNFLHAPGVCSILRRVAFLVPFPSDRVLSSFGQAYDVTFLDFFFLLFVLLMSYML